MAELMIGGRYVRQYEAIIAISVRGTILVDSPVELWRDDMDYLDFEDQEVRGTPRERGVYRCTVEVRWDDEEMDLTIRDAVRILPFEPQPPPAVEEETGIDKSR